MRRTPAFAELPFVPGTEERHAWDVWGRDDELGSINLIGPEQVRAACGLVQMGKTMCLQLPLDEPNPGLSTRRRRHQHTIISNNHGRDDFVDGLYLQFSSQWDGLRHIRFRQHGFWGGRQDADLDDPPGTKLGIDNWGRHGIFARGVLLDAVRYFDSRQPLEPAKRRPLDGPVLEAIAAEQGVSFASGDVLVLRTGWIDWYMGLSQAEREPLKAGIRPEGEGGVESPGIDGSRETAAWLWDHELAGVAADNPAVEVLPVSAAAGFQHRRMIALFGMALGESWWLKELADECARLRRYDFLLASAPLRLPGGVGSPANAYAIL